MVKLIIQLLMMIVLPVLIIVGLFRGVKGQKKSEIYSPLDDSLRGTTYRHDDVNPPTDTRQLVESEQVEKYEQAEEEKVPEIEIK